MLLEDLIAAMANERPRSKSILFKSVSGCVEVAISLFPAFLSQPDILDLLMGFFLTLFSSLKSQVSTLGVGGWVFAVCVVGSTIMCVERGMRMWSRMYVLASGVICMFTVHVGSGTYMCMEWNVYMRMYWVCLMSVLVCV